MVVWTVVVIFRLPNTVVQQVLEEKILKIKNEEFLQFKLHTTICIYFNLEALWKKLNHVQNGTFLM